MSEKETLNLSPHNKMATKVVAIHSTKSGYAVRRQVLSE